MEHISEVTSVLTLISTLLLLVVCIIACVCGYVLSYAFYVKTLGGRDYYSLSILGVGFAMSRIVPYHIPGFLGIQLSGYLSAFVLGVSASYILSPRWHADIQDFFKEVGRLINR